MTTLTTGRATDFITFSRPGATGGGATVTDRDGKIKWAGHNLLTNSESFGGWGNFAITVSANALAAPSGASTADLLTSTNNASAVYQAATMQTGVNYTFAVWARGAVGGETFKFSFKDSTEISPTQTVTTSWQLYTWTSTTAYASDSRAIRDIPNGAGIYFWGAHLYRSDLGGMQQNPAMPAGMQSYYPTTPRNLLGATENFTSSPSPWNNVRAAVTADAEVAPNGLRTADAINQTAGSTAWALLQQTSAVAAGRKVFSVYAKPNGKNYLIMQANLNGAGNALTYFNVATGAVGTTNASHTPFTPVSLGNGWYRFAIALDTTAATWSFGVGLADTDNSTTVTDVGGLYLWGAQLSDSASLDAYSPVYGAAVTSAAYYAPRLDYDANGSALGLLVEEQRTNALTYSQDFTNAVWQSTGTLTQAQTDPAGSATAVRLAAGSSNNLRRGGGAITSGVSYTFSVYMRAVSGTATVRLSFSRPQPAPDASQEVSLTTTWTRYSITLTAPATDTSSFVQIGEWGSNGWGPTGDILIAFAQKEDAASFPTSYIPTIGNTTATRTADVASVSTQAFPYSASASTLVLALSVFNTGGSNLLELSASASANGLLFATSSGTQNFETYVDSTKVTLGLVTRNAVNKLGIAYDGSSNGTVLNGGAVSSVGTTVSAAANKLGIGSSFGGLYQMSGHIRQITYLPRRLANAELQTRTA